MVSPQSAAEVKEGDNVTLKCQVEGTEEMKVEWFRLVTIYFSYKNMESKTGSGRDTIPLSEILSLEFQNIYMELNILFKNQSRL